MGNPRQKPKRLGGKLRQIRLALGLSQSEMLKRLNVEDSITYHQISGYESGKREPPLYILCAYADAANVFLDVLARDYLDLPKELPSRTRHEGVKHKR